MTELEMAVPVTGSTVWWSTLDREGRERLGRRGELDPTPDVLVVGGGAVGLATAALCRRAGLGRVQVVERAAVIASAASGGAAGLLAPDAHAWTDPPAFVDLGRSSLALYRALDREWEGALGVAPLDLLLVGDERTLPAPPPGCEALTGEAVADREPALAAVGAGLLVGGQARVHPLRLAAGLARRAGTVATSVEALALEVASGRVTGVRTTQGRLSPGSVVFATGTAPAFLDPFVRVPQRLVKGHLLATDPVPFRVRASVGHLAGGGATQLPDGALLSGGSIDEDLGPGVRDEAVEQLRADLARVVPAASSARVAHRWCCFRPATADLQPVIDRVPGLDNAWLTCGHHRTGILMAPATGQALATWIGSGRPPEGVAPFTASRFAGP